MAITDLLYRLALWAALLLTAVGAAGQCQPPTLVQVSDAGQDFVTLSWLYFGQAEGWELELVPLGQQPTLSPTTPLVTEKTYTFSELDPAAAYTVFIRTICNESATSDWNPIAIRTQIPQPSPCLFDLPIRNNNCSQGLESFDILVEGVEGSLGEDLFLASVDLILAHTWPADLDIRLESSSGAEVILSQHNGTVTDNYGDVTDCDQPTRFSDLACVAISDEKPPFIGTYTPRTPLNNLEDGSSADGTWKLKICDRSEQDVGTLMHVQLHFEPLICDLPRDIIVKSVGATQVEVTWSAFDGCSVTEIELGFAGSTPGSLSTFSLPCSQESFVITGLMPDTEYDIYVLSNCLSGNMSPLSCPFSFTTACTASTLTESFDSKSLCTAGCAFDCPLDANIWTNDRETDDQDWIVWEGRTTTDDTGPQSGAFGSGRYLYVEPSPDLCQNIATATLTSECLDIRPGAAGCDFSFWYHMSGADIGQLTVLIYADGGAADTLFHESGDQGNTWRNAILSLASYAGTAATIELTATTAGGTRGDIALDQIEFRGSTSLAAGITYYQDLDVDGYGNADFPVVLCSRSPGPVLVTDSSDCDDTDENINPGQTEIPCNEIDENCDGLTDDHSGEEPLVLDFIATDDLCDGAGDGTIAVVATGGVAPYTYVWDTGATDSVLTQVVAGRYSCTVSDAELCQRILTDIEVNSNSLITANTTVLLPASCQGQVDGSAVATGENGLPPYRYIWSTAESTDVSTQLPAGDAWVIAEDANGCQSDTIWFAVPATGSISADISLSLNVSCAGGNDGLLSADAISGAGPYSYRWSTGSDSKTIDGLTAGEYSCTITDSNGCTALVSATVLEPEPLTTAIVSQENVQCYGDHTGAIQMAISGGKEPYTYSWNTGQNTDDIFDLGADAYVLTVTDANACRSVSTPIVISEPTELSAMVDSAVLAKCILSTDGYLRIRAEGGVGAYSYFWSGMVTDSTVLAGATPGTYSVTITDANNCKTTITNYVLDAAAAPVDVELVVLGENTCARDSMVALAANITDVQPPMDYNWSTGRQTVTTLTSDTLNSLPAGAYQLTVTDAAGCVGISDTITIESGPPIQIAVSSTSNNICENDAAGAIAIEATGGEGSLTYLWNTGAASPMLSDLPNGAYTVTVSDINGCTRVRRNLLITSQTQYSIISEIVPSSSSIAEGSISLAVNGGAAPYRLMWMDQVAAENSFTADGLSAGTYTVTIADQNDCDTTLILEVPVVSSTKDEDYETDLMVYPNPFSDIIYVTSTKIVDAKAISLHDVYGRRIAIEINTEDRRFAVRPLTTIEAGVYLLTVREGEKTISKKVIRVH